MPMLQKHNNDGTPHGAPVYRKQNVANILLRFNNTKWKLVESEKPKISRKNPIATDFPNAVTSQLTWIEQQTDINKIHAVSSLAKKKIVIDSLNKRAEVLLNQNNKKV